ncbi:MAG TPA: hypothetical protein VLF66_07355 [Thermoanaerobaculia bacterium]|nr:hypothetical protein [Thermoanaerobaculia bacterium]
MKGTDRALRRPALAGLAALVLVTAAGCWQGPGVESVRWAVERQLPGADYDREVHVRLGRFTTGFARWVVNLALDDEAEDERRAKTLVNAVRRVEVAVYASRRAPAPEALEAVVIPRSLERMLGREGWQVMLESRTAGERAWVLTRSEAGALSAIYLVALDPSELAVVRLEGRFDEAFARALSQRPREAADRVLADAADA